MDALLRGALERREMEHAEQMSRPLERVTCRFCQRELLTEAARARGIHRACEKAEGARGGAPRHAQRKVANG